MILNCPRDATELTQGKEDGIEVDRCSSCNGAWYDYDELEALELTVADDHERTGMIDYAKRESELDCPVCKQRMGAFNYRAHNLELDACSEGHGFWLDQGEAARVRDVMRERAAVLKRAESAEHAWKRAKSGKGGGVIGQLKGLFGGRGR